jgi:hypothetical protein
LSTLDGANGFVLLRRDPLVEGPSIVAAVGDVNGDRAADVLMCLPMTSVEGAQEAGECYLVFGGPEVGASGEVALSGLDVTTGVKIRRAMPGELQGSRRRQRGRLRRFPDRIVRRDHGLPGLWRPRLATRIAPGGSPRGTRTSRDTRRTTAAE